MQAVMTYEHVVGKAELDLFGHWAMQAIFYHLQEITGIHAHDLVITREQVGDERMAWVIARMAVEIKAYPREGERILVSTWPGKADRISYPRYFQITRPDGSVLINASSIWMIIDTQTRKFRLPREFQFVFPDTSNYQPPLPLPGKIVPIDAEPVLKTVRRPYVSELDGNMHMNNTQYAKWITDLFSPETLAEQEIALLQINYVHEILWQQDVTMELQHKGDAFVVIGKTGDKILFNAEGTFRKKK